MLISGRCHCGNIAFTLTWEPDPVDIPARACDCSFCSRHGAVWTSNPSGTLRIVVEDPSRLSKYSFGTRTAEFHVCSVCGVVPVVTSRIDDRLYGVVNVSAFAGVPPSLLRCTAHHLGDEDVAARLARRKRVWIGDVDVEYGARESR